MTSKYRPNPGDREFALPLRLPLLKADVDGWAALLGITRAEIVVGADLGIIADFNALKSDTFDPGLVHPLIRRFYTSTSAMRMEVVLRWANRFVGRAYGGFSGFFQQLAPPSRDLYSWTPMTSEVVDAPGVAGPLGARLWRRSVGTPPEPFYLAVIRPYIGARRGGGTCTQLHALFGYLFGHISVVFEIHNHDGDGLALTSLPQDVTGVDSGMWLCPVIGRKTLVSRVPYSGGERVGLTLEEGLGAGAPLIHGIHHAYATGGRRVFELNYRIAQK